MLPSWECYQHMMIPTCAPHEEPDLYPVKDGTIFHGGEPILARWTTDFDCGYETSFWYTIKDSPFDINALKAKRRYEITRGTRNFDVHRINPADCVEALADVMADAFTVYPESYRPRTDKKRWMREIHSWPELVYGAFLRTNGELCGFTRIAAHDKFAQLVMLKSRPKSEKLQVNAAIIYAVLQDFAVRLQDGYYISNGTRNVSHETNFNEYLGKYFGFRRAYCNLHIKYRWPFGWMVSALYPFRSLIQGDRSLTHNLKALLRMEEMRRRCAEGM